MTVESIVLLLPAVTLAFARLFEKLKILASPLVQLLNGLAQNSLRKNFSPCGIGGTGLRHSVTVLLLEIHSTEIKSVPLTSNPALKTVVPSSWEREMKPLNFSSAH